VRLVGVEVEGYRGGGQRRRREREREREREEEMPNTWKSKRD
jgi:hypothetical protein